MQQEFNLILCVNVSNTSCHHVTWIKKSRRCHTTRNVHTQKRCVCAPLQLYGKFWCVWKETKLWLLSKIIGSHGGKYQ